jgi:hypothetical protein
MLIEVVTSTPTARPFITRAMKNRILRFGLTATALTAFHIAPHRKAPIIRGLGGARSANEPEMMTDKPLASVDDPMSQGAWVGGMPSAFRKVVWVTVMCPTINEEITWPAVQVRTKMISARRLPSSDGTVWDTGNPSVLCSSGRPIADSRLLEMLSVWLFLKGSSSTLALEGGTSVAVICRDWASADASAIRLIAISLSGPRSGHGTEASALLSRGFAGSDVFLLNAECSVVSVLR